MPAVDRSAGGAIVTANNRVAEKGEDYLCTDAMPPHRARRVWRRLEALTSPTVEDMAAIHRDVETTPGMEMRERLRRASRAAGRRAPRRCVASSSTGTAGWTPASPGADRLQRGAARADEARRRAQRPRAARRKVRMRACRARVSSPRTSSGGPCSASCATTTLAARRRDVGRPAERGAGRGRGVAARGMGRGASAAIRRIRSRRSFPDRGGGARSRLGAGRRRQRHGVRDGMRGERRRARRLRLAVALRLRRRRLGELPLDRVPRRRRASRAIHGT